MAIVHGKAGEWARVKGTVYGLWPLYLCAAGFGFSLALIFFAGFTGSLVGAVLLVASLVAAFFSLQKGLGHVERYFKGARGEERVSGILQNLPDSYHVFNDFVAGGKHIDHVVVGPAGVFAIETKFWRGKVTLEDGHILLDGQLPDHSPLAQVTKEASLVKSALAKKGWTGSVTPVLAFASDTFEAKIAETQGAVILNSNHLRESFATERVVIAPTELARLVQLMETNA